MQAYTGLMPGILPAPADKSPLDGYPLGGLVPLHTAAQVFGDKAERQHGPFVDDQGFNVRIASVYGDGLSVTVFIELVSLLMK